jgi:TonB family protein
MPHADVLDQPEQLRSSFLASIGLHVGTVLMIGLAASVGTTARQQWGDPKSLGGGAVGITPVAHIPLPARAGIRNPVANDTESTIPSPPKPQPKTQRPPEREAIPIKNPNAPKRAAQSRETSTQKFRPYETERPNQVYNPSGQATVSPMISLAPGAGGVGSGSQNPFGYGFAWYASLIRDKVARNWHTEQVDARLKTAPDVVVVFELYRDGAVRNVKIGQPSGNFALDQSALRAVAQAAPFQPFPPNMPQNSYTINFSFSLSR